MERKLRCILALALVGSCLTLLRVPVCSAEEVFFEEAHISGQSLLSTTQDGEQAVVALGNFSLAIGDRSITGRDAVVWVKTLEGMRQERHRIVVYLENGSGPERLVEVTQQGRIRVVGPLQEKSPEMLSLFGRAKTAREEASRPAPAAGAATPEEGAAPVTAPTTPRLMRLEDLAGPGRPAAPGAAAAQKPATSSQPGDDPPKPTTRRAPTTKPKEKEFTPLFFQADQVTSEKTGQERVTVLRGHVYVSQGDRKNEAVMEMRASTAIIFSDTLEHPKGARSPGSPRLSGMNEETITGIYLTEDVVVVRGERTLRAPEAFYDFTTDRAYIPDATFRTVQEQRDIPVYVRAKVVRELSAREVWFQDPQVTTSDFAKPAWSIRGSEAYVMDTTPYDEQGQRVGQRSLQTDIRDATFNIGEWPIFWVPRDQADLEQEPTALRTMKFGNHGDFGPGVETYWNLFRLLGLSTPKGVRADFELHGYFNEGVLVGTDFKYDRQEELRRYSGYGRIFGLFAGAGEDSFGEDREDIQAPPTRGRALWRHKEYIASQNPNAERRGLGLGGDWEVQFELAYLCDRNFLERFWPTEYYAGKEQENLLYAKQQHENRAFTALLKYKLNRFYTETESWPDLSYYVEGEPLLNDSTYLFSESHAGLKRFRPDNALHEPDSDLMARMDTRNEVDFPLHYGPLALVPYATTRLTYWSDEPPGGENFRPYGQMGAKSSTTFWRLYQADSRLLDLHGLRHVVTPEAAVFAAGTGGVEPSDLFPMDPDIEQHLTDVGGGTVGVRQVLQTNGGAPGEQRVVDWMRLDTMASFFSNDRTTLPGDGQFFMDRPEYSLPRNSFNIDYAWMISDATTFLAETNYDIDRNTFPWSAAGLSVARSPRLSYYVGVRQIKDMDSTVGTFGFNYQVSKKYRLSFFQQYDFAYNGGENLGTNVTVTRKLERWYAALTFAFNRRGDNGEAFWLVLSLWPEGVPELKIGGSTRDFYGSESDN